MPSPDYFLHAQDELLGMLDAYVTIVIEDIARRIVKTGIVTDAAYHQSEIFKQSNALYKDMIKRVSQISGYTEAEIRRLFNEAANLSMDEENEIYKKAGMSTYDLEDSRVLKSILDSNLRKTLLDVSNLTMTTAITAQTSYINACNMAQIAVQVGGFSYDQAIARAIKQAAEQGVTVSYPSGHVDQLDVAIRRSVLTGTNQSCADINLQYAKKIGCDYVETTAHSGARPSHVLWQGKVFCISGKDPDYPEFYSATGYGTGPGLCGWNCRHSFHAFVPGVSKQVYTDAMLREYDAKKYSYNGKKCTEYDISQIQRRKERRIRATKRKLAGCNAGMKNTDDEALKKALEREFILNSMHLKQQEKELKAFCKKFKRKYESARVQVHAVLDSKGNIIGFDRSTAQKAVWANKKGVNP